MILGDGLSNLCLVASRTALDMYRKSRRDAAMMPVAGGSASAAASLDTVAASFDERRRTAAFLKDEIPVSVAMCGYAGLAALSAAVVPLIFRQLRFHHVVILYAAAPAMAFCNAYGCGLTDWSLASSYGKLAIFAFGSWVGMGEGGIVAGLAACGVMMSVVSTASDLMQDFKTGYLTLASQRSMLVGQAVGTAMGCVMAPAIFWIFKSANDVGDPRSLYPAPYAGVYRGIALIGVEGLGALPEYCINFCAAFFAGAFLLNAFKEMARHKRWGVQQFLPSAMGMAVPFFIGAYFTIDMCVGSLILFLWERSNRRQAREFAPAVASGLLCGDGLWSLPASVLALLKVDPPICMKFFSRDDMAKVARVLK
ncbi:putative metal-nicotianamine transporter YSL8 [Iris pallida]|uniref:Metal-nicotianamine transporter YSL8 n=1 Tax=Iris pallida TaxID=29817 RepID=A0AAX6GIM0_IRIPA|nr:putative metal-nicotianamine transporter YSL8 [Iris pallida]KAJ6823057.1 putative metal-nicotianamine transporter YSL8 [Iris pallida]KAJ6828188.1 putative metal-nicotianamine transporter YSL8 [Iris pallida]